MFSNEPTSKNGPVTKPSHTLPGMQLVLVEVGVEVLVEVEVDELVEVDVDVLLEVEVDVLVDVVQSFPPSRVTFTPNLTKQRSSIFFANFSNLFSSSLWFAQSSFIVSKIVGSKNCAQC